MESATSGYSTTFRCLGALIGQLRTAKLILDVLRWKKISQNLSMPYNYPPPLGAFTQQRVANHRREAFLYVAPREDFGRMIFQKKILPWVLYLF